MTTTVAVHPKARVRTKTTTPRLNSTTTTTMISKSSRKTTQTIRTPTTVNRSTDPRTTFPIWSVQTL